MSTAETPRPGLGSFAAAAGVWFLTHKRKEKLMQLPDTNSMIHEIAQIRQIARGTVWCTTCGNKQRVNGKDCLRHGWPKCCGYTMTIDSPNERAALSRKRLTT